MRLRQFKAHGPALANQILGSSLFGTFGGIQAGER
jgi:hypothetical protein